jgi:hypothetical protein
VSEERGQAPFLTLSCSQVNYRNTLKGVQVRNIQQLRKSPGQEGGLAPALFTMSCLRKISFRIPEDWFDTTENKKGGHRWSPFPLVVRGIVLASDSLLIAGPSLRHSSQTNVAVYSTGRYRAAAGANLGAVASMIALIHHHVRQFRGDAAVHTVRL